MPKLRRSSPASPAPRLASRPDAEAGAPAWLRVAAWLSPRRLFRAIFVDQVRVRRAGSQVVIALEPAPAPPAAESPPASRAARMHAGLRRLLDGRDGNRQVLRQLAALEARLGLGDASFIHALSMATLQQMLRQLHGLVAPPPADDIALLLAELQQTLETRRRAEEARQATQPIATLLDAEQPEVTELDPATLDMAFDDTPCPPAGGLPAPAPAPTATTVSTATAATTAAAAAGTATAAASDQAAPPARVAAAV